jgi:hypothetical protein
LISQFGIRNSQFLSRSCYVFHVLATVPATARYVRAIHAVAELLARLRIDFFFAGSVARAAWLGGDVGRGSIDVVALLKPEQKSQVAMMAGNRGFRVDRDEVEKTEELDLVPLTFVDAEGDVRVHVLVATNALYGTMFGAAREADVDGLAIKVPSPEDLALLLALAEDEVGVRALASSPGFDRAAYNRKLTSIGLREHVVAG